LYHLQPTNAFFWNILHGILKEKGLIIFGQNFAIFGHCAVNMYDNA
jgi:hypothetical protein